MYCLLAWLNHSLACLNQYAAALTALATIAIAVASFLSARIIQYEKKREKADRMPILTFTEHWITGRECELDVKNIGYGPALNIVRSVIDVSDQFSQTTKTAPLILGSLGQGESARAMIATPPGVTSVSPLEDPTFHAVIECDDILDQHYEFIYQNRTHLTPAPIIGRKLRPAEASRR